MMPMRALELTAYVAVYNAYSRKSTMQPDWYAPGRSWSVTVNCVVLTEGVQVCVA